MKPGSSSSGAFTLIELLCTLAIIAVIAGLSIPALISMKAAGDMTHAAYEIAAVLQRARTYAMTHNTYVWVGFYEQAYNNSEPVRTTAPPPYPGKGEVIISTAASIDGTSIYENTAAPQPIPDSRVRQVERMVRLRNVHLADVGAPSGASNTPLDMRPDGAYAYSPSNQYRISSDSPDTTPYPLQIGAYVFYKTIRFSPDGEASINGAADLRRIGEIGVLPTHGVAVQAHPINVAAIQFAGIGGNVQIYRR